MERITCFYLTNYCLQLIVSVPLYHGLKCLRKRGEVGVEERTRGDGNKGVTMARGGEGAGVGVTLPTWRSSGIGQDGVLVLRF